MIPNINIVNEEISDTDLRNEFAKMQKLVRFILTKGIESDNVIEIGQWFIDNDRIYADDGDVGLSTRDTGADDIRIWAGDAIDGTPKFKVTKSGIMTAVGAFFLSALGYPRVELNSINNLIAAYADSDTYVAFIPSGINSVPTLVFVDGGTTKTFLNRTAAGGTTLGTFDNEPLNLQASGPLQIGGNSGYSGAISVVTGVNFTTQTTTTRTINITKGIVTSVV